MFGWVHASASFPRLTSLLLTPVNHVHGLAYSSSFDFFLLFPTSSTASIRGESPHRFGAFASSSTTSIHPPPPSLPLLPSPPRPRATPPPSSVHPPDVVEIHRMDPGGGRVGRDEPFNQCHGDCGRRVWGPHGPDQGDDEHGRWRGRGRGWKCLVGTGRLAQIW